MRIDLDWFVGTIRIGGEKFLGPEPGTTYDFVCSVTRKGNEAHIFAAHGIMNRTIYKMIRDTLREQGITTVTYERLNTETRRTRAVEVI